MALALLDRDGVLNIDRPESVRCVDDLVLIQGAAAAVARLNAAGWPVVVVTNQSVVGRGVITEDDLADIHRRLRDALGSEGAVLDDILVCTDPPGAVSTRRKPAPGMLLEALDRYGAVPEKTSMIGDSLRDMEAAARAGCRRILVRTGKGGDTEAAGLPHALHPVIIVDDLGAAVDTLLAADR